MIKVLEQNKLVRVITYDTWTSSLGTSSYWRIHWPKSGKVERLQSFGNFDYSEEAFDALCRAYPNRSFRWEEGTWSDIGASPDEIRANVSRMLGLV